MSVNILRCIKFIFLLCFLAFAAFSWITVYAMTAALFVSVTPSAGYIGMGAATVVIAAVFYGLVYCYRKSLSD